MSPRASDPQPTARSPLAGCAILVSALLVMVFLIVFSTLTLFRQFNEIARFTAEKPAPVEVSALDGQEAAINTLAEKLEHFRQQLAGDDGATLALTPADLNLAIAAYEPFKDLRGKFRVLTAEEDGTLRIAISFPLNGKPRLSRQGESGLVTTDPRYLNGTLVARPGLLQREVVLKLENIEAPGATVPREFIEQMSPYRLTERYLTDPVLGPAMAKLTRVTVSGGTLTLARVPGEVPADAIGRDQVNSAGGRLFRFLGVAAVVFLLIAGTVVFIGLRAKGAKTVG